MTMPFEKEYLNLGEGMNLASGVFTAPKPGIYAFSFKGNGYATTSSYAGLGDVLLQRNGENVGRGLSLIGATPTTQITYSTVSVHGTLKLNKGDTIRIVHVGGTIFSDSYSPTQFTGSLLEEELVIS